MKYICLGYMDPKKWETMSESERNAFIDECFAYDDVLRKNGHFVGGEALQGPRNATTLRFRNGKVSVTAGPYAVCRNPLYIASFLIIVSLSVFLMSLSIHAAAVTLAIVYALVIVPSEERHALTCFGEAYRAYAGATPRFWPRSLRVVRPGWIEIKVGAFLREYARTYGLIALGAAVDLLAYCRTQSWWPTPFRLP